MYEYEKAFILKQMIKTMLNTANEFEFNHDNVQNNGVHFL